MVNKQSNEVNIGKIQTDIEYIKSDITEIKTEIKELKAGFVTRTEYIEAREDERKIVETLVTKEEFKPYKAALGVIGGAVILAIVNSILRIISFK